MGRLHVPAAVALLLAAGCGSGDEPAASDLGTGSGAGATGGGGGTRAPDPTPTDEVQPEPAAGDGVLDPAGRSLHDRSCAGIDWQLVDGWLLLPHKEIETSPPGEIERCVERYAGWVTHEADAAKVSRASVYAALAATGQCDADHEYDGAVLPAELCAGVHTDLDPDECLAAMQSSRAFGISTIARALALPAATKAHASDPPLMAAWLGNQEIACGGDDRWKLVAPAGFIDRYVAAYNASRALASAVPTCKKRVILTVALYTGMDDPGVEGVARANGCWTYERVAKSNAEWKICNYDGTVHHPSGVKWAYDDTNTGHSATLDKQRILDCKDGVPGRGYVYMTNRGSGWPKRVTEGVRTYFAEIYSSQYTVDDQFGLWKDAGAPGDPMLNFGEPDTSSTKIHDATAQACKQVKDGGFIGVYVYPEPLRTKRMSALVKALNECTQ